MSEGETLYANSPILHHADDTGDALTVAKSGDEVSAESLNTTEDHFNELKASGVVSDVQPSVSTATPEEIEAQRQALYVAEDTPEDQAKGVSEGSVGAELAATSEGEEAAASSAETGPAAPSEPPAAAP